MIEPNYFSYKDLSARVVKKDNKYLRYIFNCYKNEYDNLMNSGLYDDLLKNNLIISHEELFFEKNDEVYKLILPHQIPCQSYPFEWSYRQWRKAILVFLKINQISLKYGMILKDASPYNFYFEGGNAIMFDTTSFIFFKENDKWAAYRQFCQEFLSPLALMYYNGPTWGKLTQSFLKGFPLLFVSKQLPLKSLFNLSVFFHIYLHSKYINKPLNEKNDEKKGFTLEKIISLFSMIESSIFSWNKTSIISHTWDKYYENEIESEKYLHSKEQVILDWIELINPYSVLDLGANTGRFSFLVSSIANKVISLESDENCVDEIVRQIGINNIKNVFPVLADLAEPSPPLGLMNKELQPLFERVKSEGVLSLALIHHLYFTKDMSFDQICQLCLRFTSKFLIMEYIQKSDRKVKGLIHSKPQREVGYTFDYFKSSFIAYFDLLEIKPLINSDRILCLFKIK